MNEEEIAYLRAQAVTLRALGAQQPDPDIRDELLALAERCESLANHMSGNGAAEDL